MTRSDSTPASVTPRLEPRGDGDASRVLGAASLETTPNEAMPRAWLALFVRAMPEVRAAVLVLGPANEGPFLPRAQHPMPGEVDPALRKLVATALQSRSRVVRAPSTTDRSTSTSSGGLYLAEPFETGGDLQGAIGLELTSAEDTSPERAVERVTSALQLAWGWLAGRIRDNDRDRLARRNAQVEQAVDVVCALTERSDPLEGVPAFATELADALSAERVAVGFVSGPRVHAEALSHSARFGERTNVVRAIEAAMNEAVDLASTVVSPEPAIDANAPYAPERGGHAHEALTAASGAPHVCTRPLFLEDTPVGAVTIERADPFDEETLALLDVVCGLATLPLHLGRLERRSIGRKLIDGLGALASRTFGPDHVAWKLGLLATLFLLLFLTFAEGDFRVTADATLEPTQLLATAAPMDGYIAASFRRAGDLVEANEPLGALDDRDLVLERLRWESTFAQADKRYRQSVAERDAAESAIQAAAKREAQAELTRIERLLDRVEMRAPFDGIVVSGDLSQRLGAPVERGEVLFEVAPLDGYRIALRVDEADIAHVAIGQTGRLILASLPDQDFAFEVAKITPVAEAEEGANTFRVEARLLNRALERMRPGIEGIAKVDVGERSLFWIWTREATTWLRLQLWSWLP